MGWWGSQHCLLCFSLPPRDQEGISDDWAARPLSEVFYPKRKTTYLFTINNSGPQSCKAQPFTTATIGAAASCLCQEKPFPSLSICGSCQPRAGLGSSTPSTATLPHRRHGTVVLSTKWGWNMGHKWLCHHPEQGWGIQTRGCIVYSEASPSSWLCPFRGHRSHRAHAT